MSKHTPFEVCDCRPPNLIYHCAAGDEEVRVRSILNVGVSNDKIHIEVEIGPDVFEVIRMRPDDLKSIYEYITGKEFDGTV